MGLHDNVVGVPEIKCDCGAIVDSWQSKSGPRQHLSVHYSRVSDFYAFCQLCNKRVSFQKKSRLPDAYLSSPIEGVTMNDFQKNMGA